MSDMVPLDVLGVAYERACTKLRTSPSYATPIPRSTDVAAELARMNLALALPVVRNALRWAGLRVADL